MQQGWSLLGALDALTASRVAMLLILVFTIVTSATTRFSVSLTFLELLEHALLSIHIGVIITTSGAWQCSLNCVNLVYFQRIGECHFKHYEKVTEFVRLLVEGKTFLRNRFEVIRLNNLAWLVLNSNLCAIEVRDNEVNASKGFNQSDFVLNQKISTLTLESLVRLLLHHDNHVTRFLTRVLVGFTVERILAIVWRTFVDHCINNFLLLHHFLAFASLALVGLIDDLTFSTAVVTRALGLRVHARSKLGHARNHTSASAGRALLYSAFLATKTTAACANTFSVDCNFGAFTSINLLECALERMHDRLAFLWSAGLMATSATKHGSKEVVHATATTATFLNTVLAIFIVKLALVFVTEHLVS